MAENDQILHLMVPSSLRDDLVDLLITLECISGFNLYAVDGFSKAHSQYDLAEKVAGFRTLYRLEAIHQATDLPALLEALKPLCQATPLRYWVTPILSSAHLCSRENNEDEATNTAQR